MLDCISSWLHRVHPLGWSAVVVAAGSVVTIVAGLAVVVAMPADFFLRERRRPPFWQLHPALRLVLRVGKNVAGVLTFLAGVVMALPLVPGPGLLFMLLGLGLVDFPGKRTLERRLLQVPRVLSSVNRLRARFGKPPLRTDAKGGGHA